FFIDARHALYPTDRNRPASQGASPGPGKDICETVRYEQIVSPPLKGQTMTDVKEHNQTLGATAESFAEMARFLHLVTNLKRTKRTGWLDRGLDAGEAESIADHSYRVALLAWMIAALDGQQARIDPNRVLLVALAHDLPEALA